MTDTISYNEIANLAESEQWPFTPAEAHGTLSALLVGDAGILWSKLLFPGQDASNTACHTIASLSATIESALSGDELGYQLFIPEETNAAERAEALKLWVQGFIIAHNYLNERHTPNLDEPCQSFIQDLHAFSALDTDLADTEENHRLLTELEEHCRIGVMMIYTHTHTPQERKNPPIS